MTRHIVTIPFLKGGECDEFERRDLRVCSFELAIWVTTAERLHRTFQRVLQYLLTPVDPSKKHEP